ncbi:MAG: superoxide dismutase family protein [Rhodothermus sp.]|nr:superoxide dismutase family protein [Rhodothermus sp.]
MRTVFSYSILVAGLWLGAACQQPASPPVEVPAGPEVSRAVAVLYPTDGHQVTGVVHFTQTAEGIQIEATVSGLTPGLHGFHIHEWGDCSAPDATSAGGHFNPTNQPHGAPDSATRHVGDLGNLEADEDGMARYSRVDTVVALSGPRSIIGRAVVVHAAEDDLTSQPTGNAGGRLACGVIGIAAPATE